jgi:tellurite resistance protein TerC
MKLFRRIVIGVVGGTVLLFGVVMIFLPLPSILVIPLGLGILALEFAWAGHLLKKFRATFSRRKKTGEAPPAAPPQP